MQSALEEIDSESQTPPKWIRLNVGGRVFVTSYSTIAQREPNMLSRMFSSNLRMNPSDRDESGAYLLDRSPEYFEVILNYLRHGQLIYNRNVNPEGVLEEARFFGIESLVQQLQAVVDRENSETATDVPLTRQDVVKALIQTNTTAELRFQGVNLAGADLRRLDLRRINFKYANLSKCNLSFANLSNCCLERADLSHANMESAQLISVRGLCANMEGANLKNANFEDPTGIKSNMEGVNLKNSSLEGANMAGINLRVANLKHSNMMNCNLRGAVLAGADLEVRVGRDLNVMWAVFVMHLSSFQSCNLSGSDLHEANLRGANLNNAELELMMTPIHMNFIINNNS